MGVLSKCVFSLNGMMTLLTDPDYWACIGVKDRAITGRSATDCCLSWPRVKWAVVLRCEINRYTLLLDTPITYCQSCILPMCVLTTNIYLFKQVEQWKTINPDCGQDYLMVFAIKMETFIYYTIHSTYVWLISYYHNSFHKYSIKHQVTWIVYFQ